MFNWFLRRRSRLVGKYHAFLGCLPCVVEVIHRFWEKYLESQLFLSFFFFSPLIVKWEVSLEKKSGIFLMKLNDKMKKISDDHNMSWPWPSMQQSVLSSLGVIQPPGHHFLAQGIEISIFPMTGVPGWFWAVNGKGRPPPRQRVFCWFLAGYYAMHSFHSLCFALGFNSHPRVSTGVPCSI